LKTVSYYAFIFQACIQRHTGCLEISRSPKAGIGDIFHGYFFNEVNYGDKIFRGINVLQIEKIPENKTCKHFMPQGIEQIIPNQIASTKLRRFSTNGKESRIFYRKIDLYWLKGTHLSSRF